MLVCYNINPFILLEPSNSLTFGENRPNYGIYSLRYILSFFFIWQWLSIMFSFFSFSDFGSIFSTLLPGTMAKLEPPEGCSFLDGLEVKVAFGSVWKQSLSELSGGQRSLLALSLILALLLFKPAPLYILDEVCFTWISLELFPRILVSLEKWFFDLSVLKNWILLKFGWHHILWDLAPLRVK